MSLRLRFNSYCLPGLRICSISYHILWSRLRDNEICRKRDPVDRPKRPFSRLQKLKSHPFKPPSAPSLSSTCTTGNTVAYLATLLHEIGQLIPLRVSLRHVRKRQLSGSHIHMYTSIRPPSRLHPLPFYSARLVSDDKEAYLLCCCSTVSSSGRTTGPSRINSANRTAEEVPRNSIAATTFQT